MKEILYIKEIKDTIRYMGFKNPDGLYKTIEPFVSRIQECLVTDTKGVAIELQPGDGTRYRYRMQWHLRDTDYLEIWWGENCIIIPKYISPCFLGKAVGPSFLAWEACMLADLANRICDTSHQTFYDWDGAIPQYVLDETAGPYAWHDDKKCDE